MNPHAVHLKRDPGGIGLNATGCGCKRPHIWVMGLRSWDYGWVAVAVSHPTPLAVRIAQRPPDLGRQYTQLPQVSPVVFLASQLSCTVIRLSTGYGSFLVPMEPSK